MLRSEQGLKPEELAVRAQIDPANLRGYENGRSLPNLLTLTRIAAALHAEPASLLEGLTLEHFAEIKRRRGAQ